MLVIRRLPSVEHYEYLGHTETLPVALAPGTGSWEWQSRLTEDRRGSARSGQQP